MRSAAGVVHALVVAGGAPSGDTSASIYVESFLVGVVMVAIGAVAYTGLWRAWSRNRYTYPLGIGVMGVGALAVSAGRVLPPFLSSVFLYLGLGIGVVGAMSMIGVPRVLLPAWYRARMDMDSDRNGEDPVDRP
ncbi:hypothetical protein [Clavibacter sp. CFBP 8614]|uniref:hypothetical protein n=1 Tax=unclassified Clavibacter TaxID=2626594 RepID=UPI0040423237